MFRLICLFLALYPIPVEKLMLHFEYKKESTQQAAGFEASTDHPFKFGRIDPDWSSCTIDTVGTGRKKFVDYHFTVRTEYVKRSVHSSFPKPTTSPEVYEYALPVKTELVFRFSEDLLEYMGLRCTVFKNPEDTTDFKNGLVVDVNPFSDRMLTFQRYEGGRIIQEYTDLDSAANDPNYTSRTDRNRAISYSLMKDIGPGTDVIPPVGATDRKVREWTRIYFQIRNYKYYIKVNKS